jgi:outer membrane protein
VQAWTRESSADLSPGRSRARLPAWLAAVAAGLLFSADTLAQDGAPGEGLGLAEVLRATVAANPDIQIAAQQVESAQGALTVAATVFDTQLVTDGTAGRLHGADPREGLAAIQKQLSYNLALQRLFRNGITVRPEVGLIRNSFSTLPASAASNAGTVGMTVAVPLLRDRGGVLSTATERAATHELESSRQGLRHTTAHRVLAAVIAYWDYLAAQDRVEALRSSEERAQRIADQTRVLVSAEERTATDLTQTLGNLASKRVSRISAEQALVEARQQLGLAIGLPADEIASMPRASTPFPSLEEQPGAARPRPPELSSEAYARRADLAAAEQDLRSAQALADASRNELKPRMDVVVNTGYRSAETGLGFSDFFSPLYRRGPKLDASFQFSYTLPMANSLARGRLLQSAAATEQRRLMRDDLKRRIASGVAVAWEALTRGEAGMRDSAEAVRLLESTVQAEQRKFSFGISTLFDVIQAEDALTSALLGQIQSRRNYAVAIASVRFQSGTLLAGGDGKPEVEVSRLQARP